MSSRNRIIIDTDPGVDDVLAMLLAFSASSEELEVLLLSVTYGNVGVQSCLRNVVTLFQVIEKEREWRTTHGRPAGFDTLRSTKPIVAVGADGPLADQLRTADYFHGIDGLGGIHTSHPHLSPADTWQHLFSTTTGSADVAQEPDALFTPSTQPAHEEILRLLRDNEPDTITVVVLGPMTNLARAAATDPEALLRAKEVVAMGGSIDLPGNITPAAEFNIHADSFAAARVMALTSPLPSTTMPPIPATQEGEEGKKLPALFVNPYPDALSRQLKFTLVPLDITSRHLLRRGVFTAHTAPLLAGSDPSPLAEWTTAFLTSSFATVDALRPPSVDPASVGLELHDPLCIWYALTSSADPNWRVAASSAALLDGPGGPCEDIRVESAAQWTRGMCVVDRRARRRRADDGAAEIPSDRGAWLGARSGNRVRRLVESPDAEGFGGWFLDRVFGELPAYHVGASEPLRY